MSEQLIESLKTLLTGFSAPSFLIFTGYPLNLTVIGLNKLEIIFKAAAPFFWSKINRALTISSFFLFLFITIEKQPSASVKPEIQLLFIEGAASKLFKIGISIKLKIFALLNSIFNLGAFSKDKYHLDN
jgi:hypothetical protein